MLILPRRLLPIAATFAARQVSIFSLSLAASMS